MKIDLSQMVGTSCTIVLERDRVDEFLKALALEDVRWGSGHRSTEWNPALIWRDAKFFRFFIDWSFVKQVYNLTVVSFYNTPNPRDSDVPVESLFPVTPLNLDFLYN